MFFAYGSSKRKWKPFLLLLLLLPEKQKKTSEKKVFLILPKMYENESVSFGLHANPFFE